MTSANHSTHHVLIHLKFKHSIIVNFSWMNSSYSLLALSIYPILDLVTIGTFPWKMLWLGPLYNHRYKLSNPTRLHATFNGMDKILYIFGGGA